MQKLTITHTYCWTRTSSQLRAMINRSDFTLGLVLPSILTCSAAKICFLIQSFCRLPALMLVSLSRNWRVLQTKIVWQGRTQSNPQSHTFRRTWMIPLCGLAHCLKALSVWPVASILQAVDCGNLLTLLLSIQFPQVLPFAFKLYYSHNRLFAENRRRRYWQFDLNSWGIGN